MRAGESPSDAALARPGRYGQVRDNLRVKEVRVGEREAVRRFIVCHTPEEEIRDRDRRDGRTSRPRTPPPATGTCSRPSARSATSRARCASARHHRLGGADPRSRADLLARAAARPDRRARGRRDLARLRTELERLKLVTLTGAAGTVEQTTRLTDRQRAILAALDIIKPPPVTALDPA